MFPTPTTAECPDELGDHLNDGVFQNDPDPFIGPREWFKHENGIYHLSPDRSEEQCSALQYSSKDLSFRQCTLKLYVKMYVFSP